MGLIGFWPLNGDLKDYSGNGNNAVNSGAEINNSGKIGKCYSFNGSSSYIRMKNVLKLGDSFSISFWCKLSRTNDNCFFCTRTAVGYGISIFALDNNAIRFDTGTDSKYQWYTSYFIPLNEWAHITLIKDNKTDTKQLYVNGVFHSSISGAGDMLTLGANIICGASSTNTDVGIGDSNWLGGYLNDLRIYDHALSEKEVYEISKAKILHYTFDEFREPTENIAQINGKNMVPTGASNITYGEDSIGKYFIKSDDTAWYAGLSFQNLDIPAGSVYTLSFEILTDIEFNVSWDPNDTFTNYTGNDAAREYTILGPSKYSPANTWQRVYLTVKIKDDAGTGFCHTSFCPRDATIFGHKIYYRNTQLEYKDHQTPYCNGSRKGTIRDCSGYRNDAILDIVNTPRWVDNSKIGIGAYKFDGAQYISMINPFKDGNTVSQLTLVGWMKKTANNTLGNHLISLCGNWFIRLAMDKSDTAIWMYFYYYNGTTYANFALLYGSYTDMIMNKWYHIAATFNEGIIKIYIDGNLVKTQDESSRTTSLYSKSNDGYIGSFQGSSEYANGIIDDIRIYATALSDEDILNLYRNKSSIDNKGNIYTSINEPRSIKIIDEAMKYMYDNEWCSLGTIPVSNMINKDISNFVESDNTLGNVIIEGWVYCSSPDYYPTKFEYTKENNTKGANSVFKTISGSWVAGWNYVRFKVNSYSDAANTPWYDMNRLEIYRSGPATGTDTTQYIIFKDITLRKYDDNYPIVNSLVDDRGISNILNISEVGITDGLVGWWPLVEDSKDISGYKQKSTNHNAETINSDRGLVYHIDQNKYIDLGINMNDFINTYGGYSLSVFMNCSSVYNNSHGIIFGGNGNNWGILTTSTLIQMAMWGLADDGARVYYVVSSSITANKWYHIVGSYDLVSNTIKLYVDGKFIGSKVLQYPFYLRDPKLGFGSNRADAWYANAMVYDGRLYNRVLTDEEVSILYETSIKANKIKITNDCIYTAGQFKEV